MLYINSNSIINGINMLFSNKNSAKQNTNSEVQTNQEQSRSSKEKTAYPNIEGNAATMGMHLMQTNTCRSV